jgi:4-hydroxy-2-oxoheptanedioate aldolase
MEGVANASAIAQVPGVDFVFLGPFDLASSMGVVEQATGFRCEEVTDVILEVGRQVTQAGKDVGTLVIDQDDVARYTEHGFKLNVVLGSRLLMAGAEAFLQGLKQD